MIQFPFPTRLRINPTPTPTPPLHSFYGKPRISIRIRSRVVVRWDTACCCCSSSSSYQTVGGQASLDKKNESTGTGKDKRRVFFLDVNPLCYRGSNPSLQSFGHWLSLFFREVSLSDPVIAVVDGEGGSEQRRRLLPSYKAHRWKQSKGKGKGKGYVGRWHRLISDVLSKCNVPLVRIQGHEADDVIATLAQQALRKGCKVVVASPDKDFKQLLSEDVQIVMPVAELGRWSFYTLSHYASQYKCDPCSDLSLRCILGDEGDGVPGIQQLAPGFGRKTALKLLNKHASLENLLSAAAVRTVAKHYAQDALLKHADFLRRNYQLLALRTDVDVPLHDHWLVRRDTINDATTLPAFLNMLQQPN